MAGKLECQALIPCLNEAGHIGAVVSEVRRHVQRVLVIDDGSVDGTRAEATDAGAEVIRHDGSRGKGFSVREGWALLADRGVEWVISLDGDGQHAPSDIPVLVDTALRTDADLVIGNRFATPSGMPLLRSITNRTMSRILGLHAGKHLPDSQCGFRLLRPSRVPELRLVTEHYEIESEVLLAAVRAGWRIEFVPIRTVYGGERSKIRPVLDACRWMRWLLTPGPPKARYGSQTGP